MDAKTFEKINNPKNKNIKKLTPKKDLRDKNVVYDENDDINIDDDIDIDDVLIDNKNDNDNSILGEVINGSEDTEELKMMREVILELFKKENLPMITHIKNDYESLLFTQLTIFAKEYDIPELLTFKEELYKLKLSIRRLSRKELVDVITRINQTDQTEKSSKLSRLFGAKF